MRTYVPWSINSLILDISSFPPSTALSLSELEYDPEIFADQELPVLIVGTKHVSTCSYYRIIHFDAHDIVIDILCVCEL